MIRASVSDRILDYAQFLFDQSPMAMLEELLQNCRRAGATRVEITQEKYGEDVLRVTVQDDGCGIEDPQVLLCLGGSDWDDSTQQAEIPAGMGFFALCVTSEQTGQAVCVVSKNWHTTLTSAIFKGKKSAEVFDHPPIKGTCVTFYIKTEEKLINPSLEMYGNNKKKHRGNIGFLRFYPFTLVLDGQEFPPLDFMQDMDYVVEHAHCRIGIKKCKSKTSSRKFNDDLCRRAFNFHGLQIAFSAKDYRSDDDDLLPFECAIQYMFFVDVKTAEAVDLLLPKRDEVIKNEKFNALLLLCRRAFYEFVSTKGVPHTLFYQYFTEARECGYNIHEAEAVVRTLDVYNAQTSGDLELFWDEGSGRAVSKYRPSKPDDVLTTQLDRSDILLLFINNDVNGFFERLVIVSANMKGYSWYPSQEICLTSDEDIYCVVNKEKCGLGDFKTGVADSLSLVVRLMPTDANPDSAVAELFLPAWFIFNTAASGPDAVDDFVYLEKDKSKLSLDLLRSCFFDYDDDDNDYDYQIEEFDRAATVYLDTLNLGQEEALRRRFRDALLSSYDLLSAATKAGIKSFSVRFRERDKVKEYDLDIEYFEKSEPADK